MMITSSIHDLTYTVVVKYVKVRSIISLRSDQSFVLHIINSQLGESSSSSDDQQLRMPFANLCKVRRACVVYD